MKKTAIIQARIGSTRLPGKVLADICGQPMISRVVRRVQQAFHVDQIVVAVPDTVSEAPLRDYCRSRNWNVYAGSADDVLSRFVGAARTFGATHIVRITADCPLIDPQLIDIALEALDEGSQLDYVSNVWPRRSFPRGLDVEAFRLRTLLSADQNGKSKLHREHVTPGIYRRPDLHRIGCIQQAVNHSDFRWTVDTEADLQLVREIYSYFDGDEVIQTSSIISAFLRHPHWRQINQHIEQKKAA